MCTPGVYYPLVNITMMVKVGPMPINLEEVPEDLNPLATERNVNEAGFWAIFMCYWPSLRIVFLLLIVLSVIIVLFKLMNFKFNHSFYFYFFNILIFIV